MAKQKAIPVTIVPVGRSTAKEEANVIQSALEDCAQLCRDFQRFTNCASAISKLQSGAGGVMQDHANKARCVGKHIAEHSAADANSGGKYDVPCAIFNFFFA